VAHRERELLGTLLRPVRHVGRDRDVPGRVHRLVGESGGAQCGLQRTDFGHVFVEGLLRAHGTAASGGSGTGVAVTSLSLTSASTSESKFDVGVNILSGQVAPASLAARSAYWNPSAMGVRVVPWRYHRDTSMHSERIAIRVHSGSARRKTPCSIPARRISAMCSSIPRRSSQTSSNSGSRRRRISYSRVWASRLFSASHVANEATPRRRRSKGSTTCRAGTLNEPVEARWPSKATRWNSSCLDSKWM